MKVTGVLEFVDIGSGYWTLKTDHETYDLLQVPSTVQWQNQQTVTLKLDVLDNENTMSFTMNNNTEAKVIEVCSLDSYGAN